ncbi:MAG: hypothetical protein AAFQ88_00210 [Pseudomonadota bacterium]
MTDEERRQIADDRAAPTSLDALSRDPRIRLTAGRAETEVWVEREDGKRQKIGAQPEAGGQGYLSHVFLLTAGLSETAAQLGFAPEVGPNGQRQWVLVEDSAAGAFAAGIIALLGPAPARAARPAVARPEPGRAFLAPSSVAVLAPPEVTGRGGRIVTALRNAGYAGRLQGPVPPGGPLSPPPELAVVLRPEAAGAAVAGTQGRLEALLARAGAVLLLEEDGAETAGKAPETPTVPLAKTPEDGSTRLIGPAGGVLCAHHGLALGPIAAEVSQSVTADGTVALLGQSRGLVVEIAEAAQARGLALGTVAALGTPAATPGQTGVETLLQALAAEERLKVALLAVERVTDGALLRRGLESAAAAGIAVIALDARPAGSALEEAALPAILMGTGAWLAADMGEALDLAAWAAAGRFLRGPRLGLLARAASPGIAALIERTAAPLGLRVERLTAAPGAAADALIGPGGAGAAAPSTLVLDLPDRSGAAPRRLGGANPPAPSDPVRLTRLAGGLAALGRQLGLPTPPQVPRLEAPILSDTVPDGALDASSLDALLRQAGFATAAQGSDPAAQAVVEVVSLPIYGQFMLLGPAMTPLPLDMPEAARLAAAAPPIAGLEAALARLGGLVATSSGRIAALHLTFTSSRGEEPVVTAATILLDPA